ncbi:thermonuclease family protein [Paracoccus sp. MC1854]|nr:thermonuclease family protein [Paracoccus sp. MC1854]
MSGTPATSSATSNAPLVSGIATVVDGDTLRLGPLFIRIHGIDAPEQGQTCQQRNGRAWDCGSAATAAMAEMVEHQVLRCVPLDMDVYGRIIARCEAADGDLGREMVARGLAWAYSEYSKAYSDVETAARTRKLGIWQGAAQPAWEYRANRWERAVAAAPSGCPIKGNISGKGERIYHTPWSPVYERTQIDEAKGERWFCDEAEAAEAGWRPARWR